VFLKTKMKRVTSDNLKQNSLDIIINKKGCVSLRLNTELLSRYPCRSTFHVRLFWPLCRFVVLAESFVILSIMHKIPYFITFQLYLLFVVVVRVNASDSNLIFLLFPFKSPIPFTGFLRYKYQLSLTEDVYYSIILRQPSL
jgi:hypothetical protein